MSKRILFVLLLGLIYLLTETYSQQCSIDPNISKCQGITCGIDIGFKYLNQRNSTFCNCSWNDLGVQYTECDDNNKKSLFYYFKPPATCLNFPLPNPITDLDCGYKCPVGSAFDKASQQCVNCQPGTFSYGGYKEAYTIWQTIPQDFTTSCERVGTFSSGCNSWAPRGAYADSGDNIRYNNLRSILQRKVDVLSNGYVKFDFKVEAEEGYDYFYFQIDDTVVLRLSTVLEWRTMTYNLTSGSHTLRWGYSKDISLSYGLDQAQVRNIEIGGIGSIPTTCTPCPAGSASNGQVECQACPAGFYAPVPGSPSCLPCEQGHSSFPGSASCFAQSAKCTEQDFYSYPITECVNGEQTIRYDWIKPKSCNDTMEGSAQLPADAQVSCQVVCKPGQQKVGNTCEYCQKGYISTDGQTCTPCEAGTASQVKSLYMDRFHFESWETAPLKTECKGACVSTWRYLGEVLDSGLGNGVSENALIIPLNQRVQSVDISMALGCVGGEVQFFLDNQLILRKECSQCFGEEGPHFETITLSRPRTNNVMTSQAKIIYNTRSVTNQDPYNCSRIVVDSITVKGLDNGGSNQCIACAAGTFAQDHDVCTRCPAGQYSGERADTCQTCEADHYSTGGSSQCYPCGNGLTAPSGSGKCYWRFGQCKFNTKLYNIQRTFDLSILNSEISAPTYSSVTPGDTAEYFFDICRTNSTLCGADSFMCRKTGEDRFTSLGSTFDATNIESSGASGITVTLKNNDRVCFDNSTQTLSTVETTLELKCRPKFATSIPSGPTITKLADCKYRVTIFRSEVCPLCNENDYYETQTGCVGGKKEYRWIPKTDIASSCANGLDRTTNTTVVSCFENAVEFPWWVLVVAALVVIVVVAAISAVAIFLFLRYRQMSQKYSQLIEESSSMNQQL